MFTLDSNAGQVADDLSGAVEDAARTADVEAAKLALDLVAPGTPRQTGRLAAGSRSAAVPAGGFDLTNAVEYANIVNARTGFATAPLVAAEQRFIDLYDRHLQTRLDEA